MILEETGKERKNLMKDANKDHGEAVKNPYRISWFDRIPFPVKAIVIKYWFFGMVYFFFVMGMIFLIDFSDETVEAAVQILLVGLAMGFLNDFIVNNILETLETNKHEAHFWWIFKSKKAWSLLINVPYSLLWSYISFLLCASLASWVTSMGIDALSWAFREPFSFALIGFLVDGVFVLGKDAILLLVQRLKGKRGPAQ
jgi:hypothetical protein